MNPESQHYLQANESDARLVASLRDLHSGREGTMAKSDDAEQDVAVRLSGKDDGSPMLSLVRELLMALQRDSINYCHWKSNVALDRSASGENDLDLLVAREEAAKFSEILYGLGFKQAQAPADRAMPGVLDFYAMDRDTCRIVHAHVHYRMVIGDDRTKNYHLPIERAYLDSTTTRNGFRIPTCEAELISLVLRMVIKHASWDAIIGGKGKLSSSESAELHDLENRVDKARLAKQLETMLPNVGRALFADCHRSVTGKASFIFRVITARRLQLVLKPHTRYPSWLDFGLKVTRRVKTAYHRRIRRRVPKRQLLTGGAMIGIVGGDGAGKTTVVNDVSKWLASDFDTICIHMGKPNWSVTTAMVRGVIKVGRMVGLMPYVKTSDVCYGDAPRRGDFPGYSLVLRLVCTARDRYLTYVKARRFANDGGIVICDRFSISEIQMMDAPLLSVILSDVRRSRFLDWLVWLEQEYHDRILPPELLLVMRVDPEIAVERKVTEESSYVRARSTEVWNLDDDISGLQFVDASQSPDAVASQVKSMIWKSF